MNLVLSQVSITWSFAEIYCMNRSVYLLQWSWSKMRLCLKSHTISWNQKRVQARITDFSRPINHRLWRVQIKLEIKNNPANFNKIATEFCLLNTDQQESLHKLPKAFAPLFGGTLGNWKKIRLTCNLKVWMTRLIIASNIQFCNLKNNNWKMNSNYLLLTLEFY
jgi:hypothetical protein